MWRLDSILYAKVLLCRQGTDIVHVAIAHGVFKSRKLAWTHFNISFPEGVVCISG